MELEQKIQNLFTDHDADIDADTFITNLHQTREFRMRNKQRLTYGVSSLIVVLLVGVISITQLETNRLNPTFDYYYTTEEMSADVIDEYYDDLMIYLADQSDDIWSTMELYYEINYENFSSEE